jgi:hypothetical protein
MALQEGLVFAVTASAYRNGVLDQGMALFGDAIDAAMERTGCEMGDLVNKVDEASARTVMRLDALLARSGPLLKVAASDRLMGLVSRLLGIAAVRRAGVAMLRDMLVRAVTAT